MITRIPFYALILAAGAAPAAAQVEDILGRYETTRGEQAENGGQDPAASDLSAPVDGRTPSQMQIDGFNQAIDQAFPMTPEQISRYREIYEANQRALRERPEPESRTTTDLISLEPGEETPRLTVVPSITSTIGFYDATGSAWPIEEFVIGNEDDFAATRFGSEGNNLVVNTATRVGWSNITVALEGESEPVVIRVAAGQETANEKYNLQIMRPGPNAEVTTASTMGTIEEAGDGVLLAALSGVDLPDNAVQVPVEGVSARAWKIGDRLYVRSKNALLSPYATAAMSGPNGMRVYEIEPSHVALFSVDGRNIVADLRLP